jgi:hypothetical protein
MKTAESGPIERSFYRLSLSGTNLLLLRSSR